MTSTHREMRDRAPDLEAAFQSKVLELATLTGWALQYHTHDSRRSQAGFPDLVLVRAPRVIFAELKSADGKATAAQLAWLRELGRCYPVEAYLWRPADLAVHIREVLSRNYQPQECPV